MNMFCKNCGKEMKNGDVFCRECGSKTESNNVKQASSEMPVSGTNTSVIAPETLKKKYPVKLVIGAIIAVIIIVVIACAVGGSSDVIKSNSESGASFNCTIEDVIERYNDNINEHIVNDSNFSDDKYEEIKNQLKLKKSYFERETENKYFVSNGTYGITIQLDDNGNVYFVDMVWGNNLSDIESNTIMILLRGLILSVQPSMDYDTVIQTIIDTDNASGILQKDDVKYMVTYESDCTRFSAVAMFDE